MAKEIVANVAVDPMKEMVTIFLPRATGNEENYLFVALNGKGYTIMRGQQVQVPKPIAEIVAESERQRDRQISYLDMLKETAKY